MRHFRDTVSFRKFARSSRRRSKTTRAGPLFIDRLKKDFQRVDESVPCVKPRENWRPGFLTKYFSTGQYECAGEGYSKCERGSRKSLIPERPKTLSIGLRASSKSLESDGANTDLSVDILTKSFKQFFGIVKRSSTAVSRDRSKSEDLELQDRLGSPKRYGENSHRRCYGKHVRSEIQHSKVAEFNKDSKRFGISECASSSKNSDVDHIVERGHSQTILSSKSKKDAEVQTSRRKKSESRRLNVADNFYVEKSKSRAKRSREFVSSGETLSKEIKTIFKSDVSNIKAKHEGCEADANSSKITRLRRKEKHDGVLKGQNATNNASRENNFKNRESVFRKKYGKKNIEMLKFRDTSGIRGEKQKSNAILDGTMRKYDGKPGETRDDRKFRTTNFKEKLSASFVHGNSDFSTESIAGTVKESIKISRKISSCSDKISSRSLCLEDSMEYFDALEDPVDAENRLTQHIDVSKTLNSEGMSKNSAAYYQNVNNSINVKSGAISENARALEQRVSYRSYKAVDSEPVRPKKVASFPRKLEDDNLDSTMSEVTILENVKRRLEKDFDNSSFTMDDSFEDGFFSISEDSPNLSSADQSSSKTKSDCFASDINEYVTPIVIPNTKYNTNINVNGYASSTDDIQIPESEIFSRRFSETERVNCCFDRAKSNCEFSSIDNACSFPFTSSVTRYSYVILHPQTSTSRNSEVLKLERHCRNSHEIPRGNHPFADVQNNRGLRNTWTSLPVAPTVARSPHLNVVTCNSTSNLVQIEEQNAHPGNLSQMKRLNLFSNVETDREYSTVKSSMYTPNVPSVAKDSNSSGDTNSILSDTQTERTGKISNKVGQTSRTSDNHESNFVSAESEKFSCMAVASPSTEHSDSGIVIRSSMSGKVLVQESKAYSKNASEGWWINRPLNNVDDIHLPSIGGDSIPGSTKQLTMEVDSYDATLKDIVIQRTRRHPWNVNKIGNLQLPSCNASNNVSFDTDDSVSLPIKSESRNGANLQKSIRHSTPTNTEIQDSRMYSKNWSKIENASLPLIDANTNHLPCNVVDLICLPVKGESRQSASSKRNTRHSGENGIKIQESRAGFVNSCKIQRRTTSLATGNRNDAPCIIENSISLPSLSPTANAEDANTCDSIPNSVTINSMVSRYVSCLSFSSLDSMRSLYSYHTSLEKQEHLKSDESITNTSLECLTISRNQFSEFSPFSSSSVDQNSLSIAKTVSNNTLEEQEYSENNEATDISSLEYSSPIKDNIFKSSSLSASFVGQNTSSAIASIYDYAFEEHECPQNDEAITIPSLKYACSNQNNASSKFNVLSDSSMDRSSSNVFKDTHSYASETLKKEIDLPKDNSRGDSGVFQDSDFDDSQIVSQNVTCSYLQRSSPVFLKSPNRVIESIDSGILIDCSPVEVSASKKAERKVGSKDNEALDYPSMESGVLRKLNYINTDSSSSDDSVDRQIGRAVERFTENLILCERKARIKLKRLESVKKQNNMKEIRSSRRQNRKTLMCIRKRSESIGSSCIFESPRWSSEEERIFNISTPSLVSLSDSERDVTYCSHESKRFLNQK